MSSTTFDVGLAAIRDRRIGEALDYPDAAHAITGAYLAREAGAGRGHAAARDVQSSAVVNGR